MAGLHQPVSAAYSPPPPSPTCSTGADTIWDTMGTVPLMGTDAIWRWDPLDEQQDRTDAADRTTALLLEAQKALGIQQQAAGVPSESCTFRSTSCWRPLYCAA